MSDLIRREDAIDIVDELFALGDCYCDRFSVVGALRGIPSAEPEQTAKFRRDGDFLRCSKCWRIVDSGYNYCPNCGAKLDWSE